MGDKIAYHPVNDEEGDVEGTATQSAPRWTVPQDRRWATQWLRILLEVVLVAVVFLLTLKIMLDDRASSGSGYKGPNDPKKDCTTSSCGFC
jgi:hypothetical protein